MKTSRFYKQAELMLRSLILVAQEDCFAVKGGTAINFFVRDMPRISVDIDLTYLPLEPRDVSLKKISDGLKRISSDISRKILGARVQPTLLKGSTNIRKLVVQVPGAEIKIEPNTVIRGSVYPPEMKDLSKKAEDLFELSVSAQTLSFADLYGGKICATLDRQHPRDLFDVKILLENEGITSQTRKAFVAYLASHDRPMNELLTPTVMDQRRVFEREFEDITTVSVDYDDLKGILPALVRAIKAGLTKDEKEFLVSIKEGTPQWDLLGVEGVDKLPAIHWKVQNIQKIDKAKRLKALKTLKEKLDL